MFKLFNAWTFIYIFSIVLLNVAFSYVPLIDTTFGLFSPMAVFAGTIFVTRDYMQRKSGTGQALIPMGIAALLSYLLADPFVAIASVAAFVVSEVADWAIYTITKLEFHKRVLWSSVISTPIDTAVFLLFIDQMTTGTFLLMVASKLIAAAIIYAHGESKTQALKAT